MSVGQDLIDGVAVYLTNYDHDVQYVHWTEKDLLTYLRLAMGIVALANKDDYTKVTDMKLGEGSVHSVPDSCHEIKSVMGVRKGNAIYGRPRKVNLYKYAELDSMNECKACVTSGDYKLKQYWFEDNETIVVNPPVPEGESVTLAIRCFMPPEIDSPDDLDDLDQNLQSAVFELMLYYAWGVDIEDAACRERSQMHWTNAMTILKITEQYQVPNYLRGHD